MSSSSHHISMEHLVRTRDLLETSLHRSRQIDLEIHKTSINISRVNHTFPSLELAIRNIACKCETFAIGDHVDRAIPPVYAVLTVYKAVTELGSLVSTRSSSDIKLYISLVKRFKQAVALLTGTCRLAIKWVEDVKQFLDDSTSVPRHPYRSNVCKTLRLLEELQETEKRSQEILDFAFGELENEFKNLLIRNSLPLQVPSSVFSSGDEESDVPAVIFPFSVVQNLKSIVACFSFDNRLEQCTSIYVEIRSRIVQTSLQGIDLDYLEISLTEFDSLQKIEGYIDEWGRHLEFLVKHVLELEYTLCDQVFGENDCFSEIAFRSRITGFIKFGNTVTKGKKEAIKLFKLLEVFAALNNLRQNFNRIFGGKTCFEIQTQTRDLVKKVVDGACDIFLELSAQVELQRLTDPPPDGAVPRLVGFVTEYSNELLDDDYKPVLDQVLEIHCSWHNCNKFTKRFVAVEIQNIVKSLELNLEMWAKRYEDTALFYIFMMNTSFYLSKHVKGTKLGDLMGESWLKKHENHVEYYAKLYIKASWGEIPALLTNNDADMKMKINEFNEAFDQVYRKQAGWVLCDTGLRWKTCQLIMQVIVPVYKSYMHKYSAVVEGGTTRSPNGYVKYSAESLENMVSCMFQPKLGRYGSSIKCTNLNLMGKIKSLVADRFSPTAVA